MHLQITLIHSETVTICNHKLGEKKSLNTRKRSHEITQLPINASDDISSTDYNYFHLTNMKMMHVCDPVYHL